MNALEIRGLTKQYKNRMAVDALDLSIKQGELIALLGQNGAGKTTTIKMLSCLLTPTSGDALMLGYSIKTDATKIKPQINVSPQETAVAPTLSVRENLELIARIYGSAKEAAKEKAQASMEVFGLTEHAKDRAKALSGGMQRRLSIAMALISEPKILFLDEPTLGLDVRARRELWKKIGELKGKITIILTTHYMEEAEALSDCIAILHEGRLKALGSAEELKQQTRTGSFEDAFLTLTGADI